MSIINDALRKADRFKKWKEISESQVTQTVVESIPQTSIAEEMPAQELPPSQPPFKVTFSKSNSEKNSGQFPILKIVSVVFAACAFFVLLIGPWISMMLNKSINDLQTVQKPPEAVRPVASFESVKVVELTPEPPSKSFKKYSSPNVGVSVRPVPRTVQQREPELVFKLTGISVLSDSARAAFINGKVVEVGDKVGDAEVTDIQEKTVALKRGSQFFTLDLES